MLKLAWRNTLRYARRSLAALGAIAFGTAALMLSSGFIQWMLFNLREHVIHSQLGHIQVAKQGFRAMGAANPFAYLLSAVDPTLAALAHSPGVRVASPRLAFNGLASAGDTTLSFIGEGLDPALEGELNSGLTIRSGEPLSASDARGVLVGSGLAEALRVAPGDRLVLLANTGSRGVNAVEATVRGTFSSVAKAYDDAAIKVPIGLARQLLKVQGFHTMVLLLDRTDDTDAVVASLRPRAQTAGLELVPWSDLADFYNKTSLLFSQQIGVLRAIIGLIVVLSVSNTMMMNVLERTSEIGTMMALGTSRRQILAGFLHEAALVGVIGGALGLVLGVGLAIAISAIGIPMPPPPGMAEGFVGRISVTPQLMLQALAVAVSTTIIAAAYPAWRAARRPIVDALRHNR